MNGDAPASPTLDFDALLLNAATEGLDLNQVDPFVEGAATPKEGDTQEDEIRPIENVSQAIAGIRLPLPLRPHPRLYT